MMINETVVYLQITFVLAVTLFTFGRLFHFLSGRIESPVYRKALRMMTFTYCFFGLVNVLELAGHVSCSATDSVLTFRITTLIVAVCQAFLFTFTMILLVNATYVTRRSVTRELVPILGLSAAFAVVCFTLPALFVEISAGLFTVFYVYLLIKYIRLFSVIWRDALRKLDNFFSDREAEQLKWVHFSFYAALGIGLLALATSLIPGIRIGIVCSAIYYVFYVYFAIRFTSHCFVYKKLEEALAEDSATETTEEAKEPEYSEEPEEPENKNQLPPAMADVIEAGLKSWMEEKQHLQSGITINDVSRYIGTNRKYLSLYINQHLNRSFRTWINELRINEAKRLLRSNPELTVNEIANRTGFAKNNHFYTLFLKGVGQTPSAWRKGERPNRNSHDFS
ncbi:MAG: AraC family transcriptional regulator [Tannerella sp.]|jgi:AraC-like DNA-binding protein|nr:AraC family transcriptional regulator [Tannerella sp.]